MTWAFQSPLSFLFFFLLSFIHYSLFAKFFIWIQFILPFSVLYPEHQLAWIHRVNVFIELRFSGQFWPWMSKIPLEHEAQITHIGVNVIHYWLSTYMQWNEMSTVIPINKKCQSHLFSGLQMWMRAPKTGSQQALPPPQVFAKELRECKRQPSGTSATP